MSKLKVNLEYELDLPEGTTHYTSFFPDDFICWKLKIIAGAKYWFCWSERKKDWMLEAFGAEPASRIKEVPANNELTFKGNAEQLGFQL